MDRAEALVRLAAAPIAHLATLTPALSPHIVPVTFALSGDFVVTMVDHKPKTTTRLQRITNIGHNPRASLLVDHYGEDWDALWWVRVDGLAEIHDRDGVWEAAREALVSKYAQYRERPPEGPAIAIAVERVSSWASTP